MHQVHRRRADASAGQVNGRKFYLHQPEARDNPGLYALLPPADAKPASDGDCCTLTLWS